MPAKKKTARRARAVRPVRRKSAQARRTKGGLQTTWKETRAALTSAEETLQKRVRDVVNRSGVDTRQAERTLKAWRGRIERERRKALRQVETGIAQLQTRAKKERRALTRAADDTVRRTLAALNIPSRHEVQELTRRVEELSRKIDRFRR